MSRITFKRVTPEQSNIYDADGDRVGEVYRQPDILSPGSHYFIVHLDDDPRVGCASSTVRGSVTWPRSVWIHIHTIEVSRAVARRRSHSRTPPSSRRADDSPMTCPAALLRHGATPPLAFPKRGGCAASHLHV